MTLHIFFKPVINKKKRCTLNFVLKTSAISYFIFFIWLSEPHLWDLQAPPVGLVIHSENHKNLLVRLSFYPGTRFMFQCRIIAQPTSLMTLKNKNWVYQFVEPNHFIAKVFTCQGLLTFSRCQHKQICLTALGGLTNT